MSRLLPSAFVCPITQDVFVDPVTTADGHSYSRAAIRQWLVDHNTSPASSTLANKLLIPNIALRKAIEEWRPMAIEPSRIIVKTVDGGGNELLGEGTFGRVVSGTLSTGTGRPLRVAIKMLPALTREEELRAFERELRAHMHAALHCDGVCVLHGTCEKSVEGTPRMCIVMKQYERSLAHIITQAAGPLDAATTRRYGHSLFRTLRQLHESGLVVQDIKPPNILVDAHDELVFADFGLAEVVRTQTRIMPSSVRGTLNYSAPFDSSACSVSTCSVSTCSVSTCSVSTCSVSTCSVSTPFDSSAFWTASVSKLEHLPTDPPLPPPTPPLPTLTPPLPHPYPTPTPPKPHPHPTPTYLLT